MVRWGKVEVPELDQILLVPGTKAPFAGHHLLSDGTTLHRPTGLRLTAFQSDYNDRGMWKEFYLTPPSGENWRSEVVARVGDPTIGTRVRDHLGLTPNDTIPFETEVMLAGQMLVAHGERYECLTAAPVHGTPYAHWTVLRRNALVLMLFWALERHGQYEHHKYPSGPFPSTLEFQPHGVPEDLHGTFRNPVWERLQAGQ